MRQTSKATFEHHGGGEKLRHAPVFHENVDSLPAIMNLPLLPWVDKAGIEEEFDQANHQVMVITSRVGNPAESTSLRQRERPQSQVRPPIRPHPLVHFSSNEQDRLDTSATLQGDPWRTGIRTPSCRGTSVAGW